MKNILQIIIAVIIGLLLGFVIYKIMLNSPCYDGTAIKDTPNYCMGAR